MYYIQYVEEESTKVNINKIWNVNKSESMKNASLNYVCNEKLTVLKVIKEIIFLPHFKTYKKLTNDYFSTLVAVFLYRRLGSNSNGNFECFD